MCYRIKKCSCIPFACATVPWRCSRNNLDKIIINKFLTNCLCSEENDIWIPSVCAMFNLNMYYSINQCPWTIFACAMIHWRYLCIKFFQDSKEKNLILYCMSKALNFKVLELTLDLDCDSSCYPFSWTFIIMADPLIGIESVFLRILKTLCLPCFPFILMLTGVKTKVLDIFWQKNQFLNV